MEVKTLDHYVMNFLDNVESFEYPEIEIKKHDNNVFLGSGSAACVAEMFSWKFEGFFLNTSNYQEWFKGRNDRELNIYIVSASGGKDAITMAEFLKENGYKFSLITCNESAPVKELVERALVFPSFQDPPTYNTSTYGSMIYWLFKEDPKKIKEEILKLDIVNFADFEYVFFMADDKYAPIAEMASRKIAESIREIASNGAGFSHGSHGMLRQPNDKRLVVPMNLDFDFGDENIYKLNINSYLGLLMAIYYVIGKNQEQKDIDNLLADYKETIEKLGWEIGEIN